jgi:soluble lytic murein transglycosylase
MRTSILWSVCFFFLFTSSSIYANTWLQQRWHFKDAYQALNQNEGKTFKRLSAQLKGYPIVHYLRYLDLKEHLETEKAETLQAFLLQYQDSPFVRPLREAWLRQLAKKRDWETFLKAYTPQKDTVLQCYHLQARLKTQGDLKGFLEQAKALWAVGKSQPKACDPVFKYLYDNEIITNQLRWKRIRLAMRKGRLRLARYLARSLSKADQILLERWQSMHKKPARELKRFKHPDNPIAREIVLHGLKRLARSDAKAAYEHWKKYQKDYAFTTEATTAISRYIALMAATENLSEANAWLEEVDKKGLDKQINQAKLQLALAKQDWQAVKELIQSLPIAKQAQSKWQYWQARAFEQSGQTKGAAKLFRQLSKQRSYYRYYAFLAADRINKPYSFHAQPLTITQEQKTQLLENNAALIRARELYFIGLTNFARKEWQAVLPTLSPEELKTAAALAHEWGWHDRAIHTSARAKHFHDLKISFPLPFYDAILTNAQAQKLEYAYVYAIMLQESLFQTDARSYSGALGLMQLMPATAEEVARKQRIKLKNDQDLLVPDINILLGTSYLRKMLDRFNGNMLLATAAYNMGPSRPKRWMKKYRCLPADVWVELIPNNQTRHYVQSVMSYTPIFDSQLVGHQDVKRMPLEKIPSDGGRR